MIVVVTTVRAPAPSRLSKRAITIPLPLLRGQSVRQSQGSGPRPQRAGTPSGRRLEYLLTRGRPGRGWRSTSDQRPRRCELRSRSLVQRSGQERLGTPSLACGHACELFEASAFRPGEVHRRGNVGAVPPATERAGSLAGDGIRARRGMPPGGTGPCRCAQSIDRLEEVGIWPNGQSTMPSASASIRARTLR